MNFDSRPPRPKSPQSSGAALDNDGADQMDDPSSSNKANTNTPSTILALPTELVQHIAATYLESLDALHFAAANHATQAAILPVAYARVVITSRRSLASLARVVECSKGDRDIPSDHGFNHAEQARDADELTHQASGTLHPRAQLKAIVISQRALCARLTTDILDTLLCIVRACPRLATVDCSADSELWGDSDEELTNHVRAVFSNIVSLLVSRRGHFSAPTIDLHPWTSVAFSDGPGAGTTGTFVLSSIDFASGRIDGILRYTPHSAPRFPDAWRAVCAHWTVGKAEIMSRNGTLVNGTDARVKASETDAAVQYSWPTVDLGVITFDLPLVPAPAWAAWARRFIVATTAGMTEAWIRTFIPTISAWRNLRLLSLGGCEGVSDTTVTPLMEALGTHLPHLRTLTLTKVDASYAALLPALGNLVDRGTVRDVAVLGFSARAVATATNAVPKPDGNEAPSVVAPAVSRIKLDQRYQSMQSSLLRPVFSIDPTTAARITVLSLSGITLVSLPPTSTTSSRSSFHVVPSFLPRSTDSTDSSGPSQLSTPILPSLLALRTDEPLRLPACPRLQCLVIDNAAHYHCATTVADLLGTQFPTVRVVVVKNTSLTIAQTDRLAGTLAGMEVQPGSPQLQLPRAVARTSAVDLFLARNVARGLDGWLVADAGAPVAGDGRGEVGLDEVEVKGGGGSLRLVANEVGQRMVDRVLRAWRL
ncbi:hypothetical protein GGF31_002074 [Allomyces arbusculus]|nr:hypothetical protein GGF31_002074 [Allomyces arbusculus]